MKKTKLRLNPLAAAIAFMSGTVALPQIAVAQDEAAAEEEVLVVSARRRDESLQEVPLSLSSFSGDQMEKQGITDLVALGASSPNTTLKTSRATNNTLTAFIRGIGQQDPLVGFEAGVGIYIDDIYLNRPQGAVLDVYEVERVEILRGPQGTLYGRNTIGGAVKYVTKKLPDETTASVKLSAGSYGQADGVVAGSVAISDTLKIGGSLASFHRGGFGENVRTGQDNYDKDIVAGRFSLETTPSDQLFVRLQADYLRDTSNPRHGYSLATASGDTPLDSVFDTNASADEHFAARGITVSDNWFEGSGFAATVEYELNDELTLKSVTAYREDETNNMIDFDSQPDQGVFDGTFDAPLIYENDQLSQEFQLNFEFDRLAGLAGIYYLDSYAMNEFDVLIAGLSTAAYTFAEIDTTSFAVFFDLSYDVTDTVEIGFGLRYTDDEKDFTSLRGTYTTGTNGITASPAFGGNGPETFTPFVASRSDDAITPKLSVSWQPVDEHHVYASYSQGFKAGSFDPRGNFTLNPEAREGYDAETVDAYEIGLKSTWLDGAIATNLAAFYSDYKDVQIPGSVLVDTTGDGNADTFNGVVTNAGAGTIQGIEFDMTADLTDNLRSTLALGILNADYSEYILNGVDISDQRAFQNTPETTGAFSLIYTTDVGAGELAINGNTTYTGFTQQFETATILDQAGYALFNLSAVWTSDDDKWQGGLHLRNIGDKEYRVAGYNFSFQTGFYGDPRTVTASLKYNLF